MFTFKSAASALGLVYTLWDWFTKKDALRYMNVRNNRNARNTVLKIK